MFVYLWYTHAMVCLQRSEDSLWERLLCFQYVGPKEWTSVLKLGHENLYLLGRLASPQTAVASLHITSFKGILLSWFPICHSSTLTHAQILHWTSGSVPLQVRIPLTCLSENSKPKNMSWSFLNASLSTMAHGDSILWTNPSLSLSTVWHFIKFHLYLLSKAPSSNLFPPAPLLHGVTWTIFFDFY